MGVPFFSIIVPVYNVAPYLRECLDSVLDQTYPNWECLCVNDGSTDESGVILDEYAKKDIRFRVFHKANGGVSSARNLALDNVRGVWVGFLDSDDVLAPWTYLQVNNAIQSCQNVDIVQYGTKRFLENEKCLWNEAYIQEGGCRYENFLERLTASQITSFFGGKVYLRRRIAGIRFKSYIIGEDLLFLTQCILRMYVQARIDIVCYGYRQRLTSVSHTSLTQRKCLDLVGYTSSILKECDKHNPRVTADYIRVTMNNLLEGFVARVYLLSNHNDRDLWEEWRIQLQQVYALRITSSFQKVRIWSLTQFPFRWVAFVLCYIPYKLKMMKIHRF